MWSLGKRDHETRLPKSFYEKGNALVRQAKAEQDPEIRKLQLDAAQKYYDADMSQEAKQPFLRTLLAVIGVYILVFGIAVYTFKNFSLITAVAMTLGAFVFFALLMGTAFLPAGYIKEKTWLEVFKTGVRALLLQRKNLKE